MTNYSELVVFFFILPVVIQIIFPLLMLIGFGIVSVGKAVFRLKKSPVNKKNGTRIEEELQFSKP